MPLKFITGTLVITTLYTLPISLFQQYFERFILTIKRFYYCLGFSGCQQWDQIKSVTHAMVHTAVCRDVPIPSTQ